MQFYQQQLKEKGLKTTYQRLKILDYLDTHRTHPSVEIIYEDIKSENPSFSKTTIYNTIETLKAHGLISTLTITGSEVRCDYKTDMHHHFYCRSCNRIFDVDLEQPLQPGSGLQGYAIDEMHSYFIGTCPACLKKK